MTAMRRTWQRVLDFSLLLVVGTLAAIIWENLYSASYRRFEHTVHFAINDVAMVFFFALAAKEIVESMQPGGALASRREAAVPLLAAAGGMIVPAALFLVGAHLLGRPDLERGWAVPCATDIAFSYLFARAIFPAGHAAIPFLLLLAVADDAIGLAILAVFYPSGAVSVMAFAAGLVPALAFAWWLRRRGTKSYWPFVLGPGVLSWAGFYFGGLHPALALVPIVPFMHVEHQYHDLFDDEQPPEPVNTLNVFADQWRVPVQLILLLFGLANAGVPLTSIGLPTWLVAGALIVGKTGGVVLMTMLADVVGIKVPGGMTYDDVALVGLVAGIGFTVALFFAGAAFPPGDVLDEVKMGALLSFAAGPLAYAGSRYRARRRSPA